VSQAEDVLGKYWGHSSFRPKQKEIIDCLLAGRDVAVVMPTGGGKSLCYQVPPVATGETCVVVSPLISLMEDQSRHLADMGIPAAALHSGVDWESQKEVWRQFLRGHLRLLYLSPERLAKEDTYEWLAKGRVRWFAIDEAHCISEWGHEFRPEYRLLGQIRDKMPEVTIAAFTASATRKVREDILRQLKLKEPGKFIVSFHRSNLRYVVKEAGRVEPLEYLVKALGQHEGQSVIVYDSTTKGVDETAASLRRVGIKAAKYHGKMEAGERQRNQESWIANETPVMVGTLAFGLGINKPDTRAVIHLALPKSVEQYYQEAGRAGRDGEEADCVLLWRKKDLALLAHFVEQCEDAGEQRRGWQRWRDIKEFVSADACRARALCLHFGEEPKWEACGKCDICAGAPDWLQPRASATRTKARRARGPVEESPLATRLRQWRKAKAAEHEVPAYRFFSDAVLAAMAERRPRTIAELSRVKGIVRAVVTEYGDELLEILAEE
jgi:ATP-dependent DNA helicase RecQ